jgi:hypothetical protein
MKQVLQRAQEFIRLPVAARAERALDRAGLPAEDPGSAAVVAASVDWIAMAQDCSTSADGGVARHYSLVSGWSSSYPETTGYIVPTLLDVGTASPRHDLRDRARRMADWLVGIQLPCGGFQGGRIDSVPVVPVVFNTGQILLGLAAAEVAFGGYRQPLQRAADWLLETQDSDGCWRSHRSPFAAPGENTYETHVAWGLFEADRVLPGRGYGEAGLANVRWALRFQHANGWFDKCALADPAMPLSHTLGYALRGILEAHRFSGSPDLLAAARRTADGLLGARRADGALPGCLRADWSAAVHWVCLTGLAQIAHCWLLLFDSTGETRYADAAFAANAYVRRTVRVIGADETRGAVKGSFPVDGGYARYEYPNWAAKFLVDSLLLEIDIRERVASRRRMAN